MSADPAPSPPERSDPTQGSIRRDRRPERARRSRPREWLRLVANGIMAGVLLLVCGVGVLAIVVPAVTGSTALTVLTSSMAPGLPPGTLVIVRPTPVDEIEVGDVITYQLHSGEPTLVTHRVVQRLSTVDGEPLFITKGDANADPDADPVRTVQVRGTVWYALPLLGHVAVLVTGRTRAVVVPIIAAALLGYAAWMLVSSLRDRRAERRRAQDDASEETAIIRPGTDLDKPREPVAPKQH